MAKMERFVQADFNLLANIIRDGIVSGSVSASLEDECFWQTPDAQCATMVFERYSMLGGNRVSLSVTLFGTARGVSVCGIASGGSQAVFVKINTFGEEAFLDCLSDILDRF